MYIIICLAVIGKYRYRLYTANLGCNFEIKDYENVKYNLQSNPTYIDNINSLASINVILKILIVNIMK